MESDRALKSVLVVGGGVADMPQNGHAWQMTPAPCLSGHRHLGGIAGLYDLGAVWIPLQPWCLVYDGGFQRGLVSEHLINVQNADQLSGGFQDAAKI